MNWKWLILIYIENLLLWRCLINLQLPKVTHSLRVPFYGLFRVVCNERFGCQLLFEMTILKVAFVVFVQTNTVVAAGKGSQGNSHGQGFLNWMNQASQDGQWHRPSPQQQQQDKGFIKYE